MGNDLGSVRRRSAQLRLFIITKKCFVAYGNGTKFSGNILLVSCSHGRLWGLQESRRTSLYGDGTGRDEMTWRNITVN